MRKESEAAREDSEEGRERSALLRSWGLFGGSERASERVGGEASHSIDFGERERERESLPWPFVAASEWWLWRAQQGREGAVARSEGDLRPIILATMPRRIRTPALPRELPHLRSSPASALLSKFTPISQVSRSHLHADDIAGCAT